MPHKQVCDYGTFFIASYYRALDALETLEHCDLAPLKTLHLSIAYGT